MMNPFTWLILQISPAVGLVFAVVLGAVIVRVLLLPLMMRQDHHVLIHARIADEVAQKYREGDDEAVVQIMLEAKTGPFAVQRYIVLQAIVMIACYWAVEHGQIATQAAQVGLDGSATSTTTGLVACSVLALASIAYVAVHKRYLARGQATWPLLALLGVVCLAAVVGSGLTAVYLSAATVSSLLARLVLDLRTRA